MAGETFGYGQQDPSDSGNRFNETAFLVRQMINRLSTMKLVKVTAVRTTGDAGSVAAVGFVDVQPLVTQLDGNNRSTSHGIVPNLPYVRVQGGKFAIILDPVVGDVGYVVCADRDISAVKTSKKESPPGSGRKYDLADGVYVGGLLAEAPEAWIRFFDGGKIECSPDKGVTTFLIEENLITAKAAVFKVDGSLQVTGNVVGVGAAAIHFAAPITSDSNITTTAEVFAKGVNPVSVPLSSHRHGGVTIGSGTTLVPKL